MQILIPVLLFNTAGIYMAKKLNISAMAGYFITMMYTLCFVYAASLVNLLKPRTIFCYIFLFGITVLLAKDMQKSGGIKNIKSTVDISLVLNNITAVAFTIIFTINKPYIYYWDELNIWGPTAKALKLFDRLYTIGINPCTNGRNYPRGNAVMNYVLTFFDTGWQEYMLLLSYAVVAAAVFGFVSRLIREKTGSFSMAVSSYLLLLLSPFAMNYHRLLADYSSISYAYGTTMVDFNLSLFFLGSIALYFYRPDKKWYFAPLGFLIPIKKSGIFFGLLVVCIVAAAEMFSGRITTKKLLGGLKNAVIAGLVVCAVYGAWEIHVNVFEPEKVKSEFALKDENWKPYGASGTMEPGADTATPGPSKRSETSLLAIFLPQYRTERHKVVLEEMKWYFANNKEMIYIKDIWLIAALAAISLISRIRAGKEKGLAYFIIGAGLVAGCFVYNLVISYQIQFYNDMMVEYPRYMISYYLSCIYAVYMIYMIVPHKNNFYKKALTCFIVGVISFYTVTTGLDYTIIDSPEKPYRRVMETKQAVRQLKKVVNKEDRVYLVYPDREGITYINYRYELLPAYAGMDAMGTGIDFSVNFREKIEEGSKLTYYNVASADTFAKIMQTYFDYVYVISPDPEMYDSYGRLFSDGMTRGSLYRVTQEKIPMQVVETDE